jgi:hypothetical protein
MSEATVQELRRLIVRVAPDPARARPVESCPDDEPLDGIIPFSSVIVLGVVVAIEDRWGLRVTKAMLARALDGGVTLRKLAALVEAEAGG